jgi:hypothetical protein
LKAKKGDTGRLLYITLMDGSKPYVITNDCLAVFAAKKADGNILYNECSIIGNTITYAFTPQTTSAVGKAECEVKLYGAENKLLTSARFILLVEDTVYNEGDEIEPEKEVSALTALVCEANALIMDVESKLANGDFIGPQGVSGVIVPANGFFALEIDSATGGLYCVTEENASVPTFTLEDGKLYYEIEEV